MPCAWLSLDAMDISGEMHLDVVSAAAGACGAQPLQFPTAQPPAAVSTRARSVMPHAATHAPHHPPHHQASHDIKKQRLSAGGSPVSEPERHDVGLTQKAAVNASGGGCGSCYGAETEALKCCNTCEQVRARGPQPAATTAAAARAQR